MDRQRLLEQLKPYAENNNVKALQLLRLYENWVRSNDGSPAIDSDVAPDAVLDKTLNYQENRAALQKYLFAAGYAPSENYVEETAYENFSTQAADHEKKIAKEAALLNSHTENSKETQADAEINALLKTVKKANEGQPAGKKGSIIDQAHNINRWIVGQKLKFDASVLGGVPSGNTVMVRQGNNYVEKPLNNQTLRIAIADQQARNAALTSNTLMQKKAEIELANMKNAARLREDAAKAAADNAYARKITAEQKRLTEQMSGMVRFGSNDFGTPVYIKGNSGGKAIRDRYTVDGGRSPVQTALARSRAGMSNMSQRAMSTGVGAEPRVFIRLPNVMGPGKQTSPSPVSRSRANYTTSLSPIYKQSVLQKLNPHMNATNDTNGSPPSVPPAAGMVLTQSSILLRLMPPKMRFRPSAAQ